MKSKLTFIILACGAGGCIGTVFGMYAFPNIAWISYIIAPFIGGSISYLVYDLELVKTGVQKSWEKIFIGAVSKEERLGKYSEKLGSFIAYLVFYMMASLTFIGLISYYTIDHFFLHNQNSNIISKVKIPAYVLAGIMLLFSISSLFNTASGYNDTSEKPGIKYRKRKVIVLSLKEIDALKKYLNLRNVSNVNTFLILNPVTMPAVGFLLGVVIFIRETISNFKKIRTLFKKAFLFCIIMPFVGIWELMKFTWWTFKYIHSDRRLICLVEGALGTLAGMYWHNPIIGLLAGALLGLVSYRVVGIWILKLKPQH